MDYSSKIYVAGHTGLVGSALMCQLKLKGFNNIVTRSFELLDLRMQQEVEAFFSQERPEYVFLAAAKVGGILANDSYKAEFIYDNLMIATNVIHAAYKFGVKKLINLGSSCIYPKHAPQPLKEEYLLSGKLEPTNEPYAIAKIAAIKLCSFYNEQYGTNFISVMPTNLYGPGDNFNLETAHVLPALIRKFHLAKLLAHNDIHAVINDVKRYPIGYGFDRKIHKKNIIELLAQLGITKDKVALWGTGTPRREFLYVDDLAQTLVALMRSYDACDIGEFINIGSGQDIAIAELAEMIRLHVGFEGDIFWDNQKTDGTQQKLLDVCKMEFLGIKLISLHVGITKTYKSYLDQCFDVR